jgi:hypothetical protein
VESAVVRSILVRLLGMKMLVEEVVVVKLVASWQIATVFRNCCSVMFEEM